MIRSRLLEIPGWYCRWTRVSRIETFRFFKNISPRSRFVLARRTLAELAKCEGIPLVFRIESLIFDDSEFWLEPIALDRFRKVHGFASSLLPPLPFSFSLLLIVLGLKSLEVDFMSFLSSVNEIVDIWAESNRDFEKNLIQSSFAIVCLSLKKLINIFLN